MLLQEDFPRPIRKNNSKSPLKREGLLRLVDETPLTSTASHRVVLPSLGGVSGESVSVAFLPIDVQLDNLDDASFQQLEQFSQDQRVINALNHFAVNLGFLKTSHSRFTILDERTEDVLRPIFDVKRIIIADIQDKGIVVEKKIAYLNLHVFLKLAHSASQNTELDVEHWLSLALSVYFLHEITHTSQGIPRHEDVKALKSVNQTSGRRLLVELDLRSDYLAAHTLSILETFRQSKSYNVKTYDDCFYIIWCKVCRGMLETFPKQDSRRKDKVRRIFGYLLMSHLLKDCYYHKSPLKPAGELLPDWNQSLSKLTIETNRQPWIKGESVDPIEMKRIKRLILNCQYDDAEDAIASLWRKLPK